MLMFIPIKTDDNYRMINTLEDISISFETLKYILSSTIHGGRSVLYPQLSTATTQE